MMIELSVHSSLGRFGDWNGFERMDEQRHHAINSMGELGEWQKQQQGD
jgi:hypothetical protein